MALENRVTPFGEIVAEPWRGTLTGNRGRLHGADLRLGTARWRTKAWIACRLAFRGRYHGPIPPGRWTALFFADEAAGLAAGHRPCGECRHADHQRFKVAWAAAGLPGRRASEIDACLHAHRVTKARRQFTHQAPLESLPDGAFLTQRGTPARPLLLWQAALHPLTGAAYGRPEPASPGPVTVLTPAPIIAALAAGYVPMVTLGGGSVQPALAGDGPSE